MSTDQAIEAEIQAKGKTAPRILPQDVENAIASEHYFTAENGVAGVHAMQDAEGMRPGDSAQVGVVDMPGPLSLLTFCVLVMRNGFTVTGESACASPENFDADIGRKIARANAVSKVWPLLGYQLRSMLATKSEAESARAGVAIGKPLDFRDRVRAEKAELDARRQGLEQFVRGDVYLTLPEDERGRMVDQYELMTRYSEILRQRIANFPN